MQLVNLVVKTQHKNMENSDLSFKFQGSQAVS